MKDNFTHMVRNCKDWDPAKFKTRGCISVKEDGVRAFYYPGDSKLWSRSEKPIYGMEHILHELSGFPWPVDMELTVPGMEFNEASGIIRNHSASYDVIGNVIDIVSPGDLVERMARRPRESEHIRHIPHLKVFAEPDVMKHYETALSSGYEGIVWKSLDHRYENKRNFDWMRMVPVKSEDCEVLGVYEGKGKMAGIAGGIYIDFKGIRCKCGTMKGMTYEDREELLANADNYVGQCLAEVEYKELQPSGKPRQPRFKRWRWDK